MERHFPFLFINRLEITLTDKLICGAIWIGGLSHFINQITSLRKWMLNEMKKQGTKQRSAKSRNNGNQYSIHLHLCMMHRLLFDETIIVNEAQVPPTGLLCEV